MIATLRAAWHTLLGADPVWVTAGFVLYVGSLLVAGARWRLIVRALGGGISWADATRATVAGVFVNNVTPTGRLGGEATRIGLTRAHGSLSLARGALATLWDRLSDVPGIAVLALAALPSLVPIVGQHRGAVLIVTLAIVLLAVLSGRWVRASTRAWLSAWRRDLHETPISRGTVVTGLCYSGLIWLEDLLRLLSVCLAFGVHLAPAQAAALCVIGVAGGFVPTIGGLGAVEGGLLGGLALFGVPVQTAIAITTVERAISYGFSTVAGAVIVSLLGGRGLLRGVVTWRSGSGAAPAGSPPGGNRG